MEKMIALKDYITKYKAELPSQSNVTRWIMQGILRGYKRCQCRACKSEYDLTNFLQDDLGWRATDSCPECGSTERTRGEWFVRDVHPSKIKRRPVGRPWPKKRKGESGE